MARKNHNPRFDLPPLELECMKILWDLGQATVQQIRDQLLTTRPLAYTTVMTVMDRLARKGSVEREKRGRAHLYRPSVSEDLVLERALTRLAETFFQGSRDELRRYLEGGIKPGLLPPVVRLPESRAVARPHHAPPVTAQNIDTTLL